MTRVSPFLGRRRAAFRRLAAFILGPTSGPARRKRSRSGRTSALSTLQRARSASLISCAGALLSSCAPADFDALGRSIQSGVRPDACAASEDGSAAMCAEVEEPDAGACETCDAEGCEGCDAGVCEACDAGVCEACDADVCEACDADVCETCDAGVCEMCVDAEAGALCPADGGACETETRLCGACDLGVSTRSRACAPEGCTSEPWSAWSACVEPSTLCSPGQKQTQERDCGACKTGTQTRSRTCSEETCAWGAWSSWSACTGVTAACAPGDSSPCANGDSCGHRVCSDRCSWGACVPKRAGGCLRIGPGHSDEGTNYRCCGVGRWQFCLPDCSWSTDCSACSEGAPNYCADCYP